jgi:hypothetical protein
MAKKAKLTTRSGTVLPLLILCLVGLLGFVALAIDLGVIATARAGAQAVADAAAMAGARTLNGDVLGNNNYANAAPNATTAATAGMILTTPVQASQVTIDIGSYQYNTPLNKFIPNYTGKDPTENWSLVRARVNYSPPRYFSKIFPGSGALSGQVEATAVHRPRDVAIVMDYSGSQRFGSLLGRPHSGNRNASNNPETVYPLFGHYATLATSYPFRAMTPYDDGTYVYGLANVTVATSSGPAIVDDFYTTPPTRAFFPAPDSYATAPAGDRYLYTNQNTTSTYAKTYQEINNNSATRNPDFELDGYAHYTGNPGGGAPHLLTDKTNYNDVPFAGYTMGPSYWGKTFFIWPPDPRWPLGSSAIDRDRVRRFLLDFGFTTAEVDDPLGTYDKVKQIWTNWPWASEAALRTHLETQLNPTLTASDPTQKYHKILRLHNRPQADWRQRFFFKNDGVTPLDDNTLLWDASGIQRAPQTSGANNYYRINYNAILAWLKAGPNPFPNRLQAGRIVYYTAIPDTIAGSPNTAVNPANLNERFWKHYIDHVLGVEQTGGSTWAQIVATTGYGNDQTWGTVQIGSRPAAPDYRYLNYSNNPKRPLVHMWFGPMSLIDFIGNYNESRFWWPGTCHESALWAQKIGVQAALQDIERNHPNDHVSLIYFSIPKYSSGGSGYFNRVRAPMGKNYTRMIDALWFPLTTIDNPGTTITPYSPEMNEAPHANGNTCYPIALMLAYNQFSSNPSLRTYAQNNGLPSAPVGDAGGLGRRGARKLLIFSTDGVVNQPASASVTGGSPGQGYYQIRQPVEFPTNSGNATTQAFNITSQICALETASPPGYGTARNPVLVHCIAFGDLFEYSGGGAATALSNLQEMQFRGNVQANAGTPLESYKIITGTPDERIAKLTEAFRRIMQDGVQVTLIE